MKNNKKFGRLFIEINGTLTDISELEKDDYEELLRILQQVITAYVIIAMKDKPKKDDKYIKL